MRKIKKERRHGKHLDEFCFCWWETAESENDLLNIITTKIKLIIVIDLTDRQERLYL